MRAIAAILCIAGLSSWVFGQEAPNLKALRQVAREEWEKRNADYPTIPKAALNTVIQFRIEDNNIAISTRLRPTNGPSRIAIDGLSGQSTVDLNGLGADGLVPGEKYTPRTFSLLHDEFNRPDCIESLTTVQIGPSGIQLVQNGETITEERDVTLMETNPIFANDEPPVRLIVAITPKNGEAPGVHFQRTASDFVTLRRLYRADTAMYLEPILRQFNAESDVFGADERVALQIFLPQATPDPKVTARVKSVVASLDSDDIHQRDEAAKQLDALGEPAAISLLHMDRSNLSPEQSSRVDAFLSGYHPLGDEDANRLRNDVNFLLDCLYSSEALTIRSAIRRIDEVTGRSVKFDDSLRGQARRDAIANLRGQLAAAEQPTTQSNDSP